MSHLDLLETPHAVVDLTRVRANIERVQSYTAFHGLALRPHTKTHKDDAIGALQVAAGARGLTVATAREAEVMARATNRLLVAYPPVDPARIARLLALPTEIEVSVALDSSAALTRLQAPARDAGRTIEVLVELDLGGKRTGISDPEQLVELARLAQERGTRFSGVLFHPGDVHQPVVDPAKPTARDAASNVPSQLARIRSELARFLAALERSGIACPIVSGGNTPTLFQSHLVPELTEIRPGTYVYGDRDIASQGVAPWSACAYSVLATVISTAVRGQVVIDAGTKSLAREPLSGLPGLGALLDRPEVIITRLSEEHGILDVAASSWRPLVGDRVRVVPNHVCVSVHLQDRVCFVDGEEATVRGVPARGR